MVLIITFESVDKNPIVLLPDSKFFSDTFRSCWLLLLLLVFLECDTEPFQFQFQQLAWS